MSTGTGIIFMYAPSQWETALQCKVVSHWLGTCTKWSLLELPQSCSKPPVCSWWLNKYILWIDLRLRYIQCISTGNTSVLYEFIDTCGYIDGLVQECGISSANALEIPQSCTKSWLYGWCLSAFLCLQFSKTTFYLSLLPNIYISFSVSGRCLTKSPIRYRLIWQHIKLLANERRHYIYIHISYWLRRCSKAHPENSSPFSFYWWRSNMETFGRMHNLFLY